MESLNAAQIEGILDDVFPDETELAGEAHVKTISETIARGSVVPTVAPSSKGYKLNPEAALITIAAAANFIKVCVELYILLKEKGQHKVKQDEFHSKAVAQGSAFGETASKLALAVYKALSH